MFTYIKVSIPHELFWTIKVDEDSKYIYAVIQNEILTTNKFNFGDLIKIDKKTNDVSYSEKVGFKESKQIYMLA